MLFSGIIARHQPATIYPAGLLQRVQQRGLRDLDARRSGRDQTVSEREERRADHTARELASADANQIHEVRLGNRHAMLY